MLTIVGVVAIVILMVINLLTVKLDGYALTAAVSSITFIVTRKRYKHDQPDI